jgi:hypothetical protein
MARLFGPRFALVLLHASSLPAQTVRMTQGYHMSILLGDKKYPDARSGLKTQRIAGGFSKRAEFSQWRFNWNWKFSNYCHKFQVYF